MRLNLHPDSARVIPKWLEIMINEFVEEFRKEYSVGHNDVYRYFFSDKLERIQQLFADHNIKVEIYSIEDLPS
jgi:DNA-binding PucR family transcriptional regulator